VRIPYLAAAAALCAALLVPARADATTRAVAIMGFGFSPASVSVSLGMTVQWTQDDVGVQHTSTSNQAFWASPHLNPGQRFSTVFRSAGGFGYHCQVHPEMTGTVRVPLTATGSAAAGWSLRWSNFSSVPSNRAFDVQIKRPGATSFAAFRTAVKTRAASFDPARSGSYQFRARTRNLSNGKDSGWSPTRTLKIT
jgi:plastocyanin